jgi:hypothetical protein
LFDIAHRERDMIDSFKLHGQRSCLLCRWRRVAGPYDSVRADRPGEAFQDNFTNILK